MILFLILDIPVETFKLGAWFIYLFIGFEDGIDAETSILGNWFRDDAMVCAVFFITDPWGS